MKRSDWLQYKYETHSHTSQTSKCSRISGADLARFYHSLGYTGLFVTDHFFNGNTLVPHNLPWQERVEWLEKGYLEAKAVGDAIGLDVFFAWEYSVQGNDFLIYGLDRDWLLDHPEQMEWKSREYMARVREDGGTVIHAHPFREAGYIDHIRLLPRDSDGVEILNASMSEDVNRRAAWYAESYGLCISAGSDNHVGKREKLAGVYLPERIASPQDFCRLIKEGNAEIFLDRYDADGNRL